MIKINCQQQTEAWHEARLGRITGTRFAQMMMGDSTKGYNDLILDIAGEILTGEAEETYTNEIMERGKDLEPEARQVFSDLYGEVEECGFVIPDEKDPYHEWIGISPDGLLELGGLEIKCPLRKTHIGYIEKGVLPSEYRYQVQASLFVTGLDFWYFMSYYPNMKPFIIKVLPDLKVHEHFRIELEKIIGKILQRIELYNHYNYLA